MINDVHFPYKTSFDKVWLNYDNYIVINGKYIKLW